MNDPLWRCSHPVRQLSALWSALLLLAATVDALAQPHLQPQSFTQASPYTGAPMSMNFQNIEARVALQIVADFTGLNIVTSDSVTGALTLRLHQVPWDQVLDIMAQAKGLSIRRQGNVVWVAPRAEVAAREKLEFESKLAAQNLEPMQTRGFSLNYAKAADVSIETRDISLSGRILAAFPERLKEDQKVSDALKELGQLATKPEANIIKLPNISASIPQLKAAIAELQASGYDVPDYPEDASTDEEREARARYDKIKGSAVNPVLREGNSDRRAPASVKAYARKHPHVNKAFAEGSKTRVATMGHDDFFSNEKSVVLTQDDSLTIRLVAVDGTTTDLKTGLKVLQGEIVDATFMSAKALDAFLAETLEQAKADNVLYSVHLKATMMKVSDPILFGHVVKAFFASVFDKHGAALEAAGLNPNDGDRKSVV